MALHIPGQSRSYQTAKPPPAPGSSSATTTIPARADAADPNGGFDPVAAVSTIQSLTLDTRVAALRAQLEQGLSPDLSAVGDMTVLDDSTSPTRYGQEATHSTRRTVASLLDDPQRWDRPTIEHLQEQLYEAGYYDPGFYEQSATNPIQWGRMDQSTRDAYRRLLGDAVIYKTSTIDQILRDRADDFSRSGMLASGGKVTRPGQVGGGNLYQTVLDDPASLHSIADEVAEKVLGRKVSEADRAKYASVIQSKERSSQHATQSAQEANSRTMYDTQVAAADGAGGGDFDAFVNRIIGKESGGNPTAIGLPTRYGTATGKYQILDSTWGGYKGFARAADAPEAVQDEFARNLLGNYVRQFKGRFDAAAVAWYAGPAKAKAYVENPTSPQWDKPQMAGGKQMPSIREYAQSVAAGNSPAAAAGGTGSANDVYVAPTTIETTQVDARAQIEEGIRKDNPAEAGAHDIANQYEQFRNIIGFGGGGRGA